MQTTFEFFVRLDRLAARTLIVSATLVAALVMARPDWAGIAALLWLGAFALYLVVSQRCCAATTATSRA